MVKHILVPTDGSPLSDQAIDYAIEFAKSLRARISVMTVTSPLPVFAYGYVAPDEYAAEIESRALDTLAKAEKKLASADIPHDTIKIKHEEPFQAIIDAAAKHRCDLIVMASHGRRGLSAIVIGSETLKVITHSRVPVLVYRNQVSQTITN